MKNTEVVDLALRYLQCRDDVSKIVFAAIQGGYARETADEKSDVDLLIAYSVRADIAKPEELHFNYCGKRFGIKFFVLSELSPVCSWLERVRYIFSRETLFIFGNEQKWLALQNMCFMTPQEQQDIIMFCLKRCARRGIYCNDFRVSQQLKSQLPKRKQCHGYRSIILLGQKRETYWIDRNDYLSAKLFCWSALEYVITIIFALNNEFVPSPKYRYYLLQHLFWLPQSINKLFGEISSNVDSGYYNQQTILCNVLTECINQALQQGIQISDDNDYILLSSLPMFRESEMH